MWVRGMRWNERLRLGRHGCEDTFLLKALAIGTTAVLRCLEARAANLEPECQHMRLPHHSERQLTLRLRQ